MLSNSLDAHFKFGAQSKTNKSILRPSCTLHTYLYERYCFSSRLGSACWLYTPTTHSSKYFIIISTVCYVLFVLFVFLLHCSDTYRLHFESASVHKVEKQIVGVSEAGVCAFCWYEVITGEYLVWDAWEIMGSQVGFQLARLKRYLTSVVIHKHRI